MMEILAKLESEINSKYQESLTKQVNFDNSCIRVGKKDHIWIYAHEWEYKQNTYREITYGSWRDGDKYSIKSWDNELNKDKNFIKAYKKKTLESKAKIDLDQQNRQKDCKEKWSKLIANFPKCSSHEYLSYKNVEVFGDLRIDSNGVLIIPTYDINGLTGVQRIYKDPETKEFTKRFSSGIKIKGSIFPLSKVNGNYIYLTEGYATGATIQKLFPKIPVICCFNASNILGAIETIRLKYPNSKICIASDNDHSLKDNVGVRYSKLASSRFKDVIYKIPKFKVSNPSWSDFNDLACFESENSVIEQLFFSEDEFSYILPLGYNERNYYFISSQNKQIVCMDVMGITQQGVKRLIADKSYWLKHYGFEIEDQVKVDWQDVASDLMKKCHEKGIFDAEKVRGIGVWSDGPNYVINDGDHVYNENPNSKFQYQKSIPIDYSLKNDDIDMLHLLEAFKNLEYKNKNDYFYVSAWYVQAQIFSCLPWRFHIWLTGSAGTGKSTILKWLHSLLINNILTNNTSSAGIRQTAKSDAISVISDETESTSGRSKQIIELAREMSSNGEYRSLRGTVSGNAINFNTQCVFCFGSIQVEDFNQADRSRIFLIEMNTIAEQDEDTFLDINERFKHFIKHKNSIFTKIYHSIDNIIYNADFCKINLKRDYKIESRLADQLSIAMACFFVYFSSDKMTKENYSTIVEEFGLIQSDYTEQNNQKEHDSAYDYLMSIIIDTYLKKTVASCIHDIRYSVTDHESEKILGTYGLKYYKETNELFIQNQNPNMKDKLKEYPDLARILKRDKNILSKEKERILLTQVGYVRGIRIKLKDS